MEIAISFTTYDLEDLAVEAVATIPFAFGGNSPEDSELGLDFCRLTFLAGKEEEADRSVADFLLKAGAKTTEEEQRSREKYNALAQALIQRFGLKG